MLRGLLVLLNMTGVPRLVFRLILDRRVPMRLKLIPAAAVAYLILPFDFVPDILPVLGRIDDLLIILISLALFLGMAPKDIVLEHSRNRRTVEPSQDRPSQPDKPVIEGEYHIVEDEEPKS